MNTEKFIKSVHPGEILLSEFLEPFHISQNKLALEIKVPARRINEIVHGKRGITADTALRLAKFFGMSPEFFLNLQSSYAIRMVKHAKQSDLARIKQLTV